MEIRSIKIVTPSGREIVKACPTYNMALKEDRLRYWIDMNRQARIDLKENS